MIKAQMKLPKLSRKNVWIGAYGGHFDVIVIFSQEPKPADEISNHDLDDCHINNDIVMARVDPQDWDRWFGLDCLIEAGVLRRNGRPRDIVVKKVVPMELEAAFHEDGSLAGLNYNAD